MLLICSYQDCLNIRYPCSPITFFTLPKDHRRKIWIKNSGNKTLKNISDTSTRFFCEEHFNPKYIRRQFNRCILHKFAEPYKYIPKTNLNSTNIENSEIEDAEIVESINPASAIAYSKIINDNLSDNDNESSGDKPTIEDAISEYIITSNDDIETQLDIALKENIESIEMPDYEEILINPKNSEPVDIMESTGVNNNIISIIENAVESNVNSVSPENIENKINRNDYENDKHFALSLVGNFQRLSQHKKAIAKIKILQYLTELEFSENKSNNILSIE